MSAGSIQNEMLNFQASVGKLGTGVSQAASLWKDEKFSELSASIYEIANNSKAVLLAGDRCYSSVEYFDSIASEQY